MAKRSKVKSKRWVAPPEPVRIWLPSSPLSHTESLDDDNSNESDTHSVSNCIAKEIHQFFHHLTTSLGSGGGGATAARPVKGQWTVVAGFIALEEDFRDGGEEDMSMMGADGGNQQRPILSDIKPAANLLEYDPSSSSETAATSRGRWADMKICSIASGVKCLGASDSDIRTSAVSEDWPLYDATSDSTSPCSWTERDSQVVDMHAEVLARRELECLLMREMQVLLKRERHRRSTAEPDPCGEVTDMLEGGQHRDTSMDGPTRGQTGEEQEDVEPILLELVYPPWEQQFGTASNVAQTSPEHPSFHLARPCFRIKSSVQLYLYTSHAPCGAASDAAHLRRLDAEDQAINQLLTRLSTIDSPTEALISYGQAEETNSQPISSFRQSKSLEVPPICKKPSRADAPPTTAFSCSDKLGRYQWLGFQGGRLSKMFESAEQVPSQSQNEQHSLQICDQQNYVGYPIRLHGLVVGEDFESTCLHKIFGNVASSVEETTYSRIGNGVQEVMAHRGDSSGKQWLSGLLESGGCRIGESKSLFAYGRAATSEASEKSVIPIVPADTDISKLRTLPLPLLRDILLPGSSPSSTPFSVALSYHAFSIPQAIGPNGRLSGVIRDKRTKQWGDNSVARVARGRMWDAYEKLIEEYEACVGKLGYREVERSKGGKGWSEAAQWMEERGPYAGWHSPHVSRIDCT
ncbi:hypothetical protein QFC21_002255 [Naganishia friedmannii]|uniref:Uncharacterized protein n=1 Tax=Naganishia friedmannii TaxID=89922 RepID=A0ACC2VWI6_9TREE|nr:hypothetical protein QFC21_002255 [Naganishia friedmannii]